MLAQDRAKAFCNALQEMVSSVVSERVVDELEAVEVQEQQGKPSLRK